MPLLDAATDVVALDSDAKAWVPTMRPRALGRRSPQFRAFAIPGGLVYELTGLPTPWPPVGTRSRNRQRLREWSAGRLALAIAGLLDGDAPTDDFTDALIDAERALRGTTLPVYREPSCRAAA